MALDLATLAYVQAANQGGVRSETSLFVIHSAECPETSTAAEGVASWFTNPAAGSTHATVDNDSVVRSVPWDRVCWGAGEGPTNQIAVQFEQAGYASQGRGGWLDLYSRAVLTNLAAVIRALTIEPGALYPHIRPVRLTADQLVRGERNGLTGHGDVHAAWPSGDGRTDPGTDYPWDVLIEMIAKDTPSDADVAAFFKLIADLEEAMALRTRVAKGSTPTVYTIDPERMEKHEIESPALLAHMRWAGLIAGPPATFPAIAVDPAGVEVWRDKDLALYATV